MCVCVHDDSLSSNIKKLNARAAAKINKAKRAHIVTHTHTLTHKGTTYRRTDIPTHKNTLIEYINFSLFLC